MKHFEATIQEIIEKKKDCPLPTGIIPDQMGINLCSVHKIVWTEQRLMPKLSALQFCLTPHVRLIVMNYTMKHITL